VLYLDTSASAKLLLAEDETGALERYLREHRPRCSRAGSASSSCAASRDATRSRRRVPTSSRRHWP